MRALLLAGALGAALVALASSELRAQQGMPCQIGRATVHGCVGTLATSPGRPGPEARGSRTGQACAWNILRLVAMGDVRVATAKRNGNITRVSSIDSRTFELVPWWGVFTRYCTVVSGD